VSKTPSSSSPSKRKIQLGQRQITAQGQPLLHGSPLKKEAAVVLTKTPALLSPQTPTLLQRTKSTGGQLTGATSRTTNYLAVLGIGKSSSTVDSLDPPSPPTPARAPEARWATDRQRRQGIVLVSPMVAVVGERGVERDEAANPQLPLLCKDTHSACLDGLGQAWFFFWLVWFRYYLYAICSTV
jgi:hypothetical protein